jgi:hypothetical protein
MQKLADSLSTRVRILEGVRRSAPQTAVQRALSAALQAQASGAFHAELGSSASKAPASSPPTLTAG